MKKKTVVITNGDEMMAAIADVRSTPFGNVGKVYYKVEKDALSKSNYYEDWELRMAVIEMEEHPHPCLDVSAVADQGYSPVDTGNYTGNYTGKANVSVNIPDTRGINHWTMIWAVLMVAWMPLQSWIEMETGFKAATWLYCYPVPFFLLMVGVSYAINRMRGQ